MNDLRQIEKVIKTAKRAAIFTHMRPDGDAIGGSLALSFALKKVGIQAQVFVESEIPSALSVLPGADEIRRFPHEEFDVLIMLDCADETRLGALHDDFLRAKRKQISTINIDHHMSNTGFAKYNFAQCCASNCMHIAKLIEYMGASFDQNIAECLLAGLITDSGQFSHDDVTEETFALAQKLMEYGASVHKLHYALIKKQSRARAMLFAQTMSKLRFYHDARFCVAIITRELLEKNGAEPSETEGFVDFPLSIDGVEVAASLMEVKFRQYRVSLRTKSYADANRIAGVYGGGGHIRASGCMLFGDLEDVLDKLSYTVSQYLEDE